MELLILKMMTSGGLASDYTAGSGEKGADVESTVQTGYGLDFKLAIQVKKSEGTYSDPQGVDQIERAFKERGADAGLLVTTGDSLGGDLTKRIDDLKSQGRRVAALFGEELYDRLLGVIVGSKDD